jgi:hypothetical protein
MRHSPAGPQALPDGGLRYRHSSMRFSILWFHQRVGGTAGGGEYLCQNCQRLERLNGKPKLVGHADQISK